MSNTSSFIDREFHENKPEHESLVETDYQTLDLDDAKYQWEYFGKEKYGRYAVCKNTNIMRGLTMGEFYGTSPMNNSH
jgi:hypothetical protein